MYCAFPFGSVAYDPQFECSASVSLFDVCLTTQFRLPGGYATDYNLKISTDLLSLLWFVYKYNIFPLES